VSENAGGLDVLMNVMLEVSVELGRCAMRIGDVLALGAGAVVGLDRPAGAPVDVLVNGKPIASGEIVAIDERYGVRIAQVFTSGCSPADRAQR
jgi:flagellar motor switch protein FliN/FliY